jgi:hypothetical protein
MKLPIHTAVISHDEGATQYVSASHGELIERIGGYCREHWSSVSDDPPPQTTRDLIDAYFLENQQDLLDIFEDSFELPEPYASAPKLLDQLGYLLAALTAYKPGDGEACAVLCREVIDTRAVIAKASVPTIPRFTVFCQEAGCPGDTVHIATHAAADLEAAIIAGKQQCIKDWSTGFEEGEGKGEGEGPRNLESVHCLGVAAGDAEILHWEDQTQ